MSRPRNWNKAVEELWKKVEMLYPGSKIRTKDHWFPKMLNVLLLIITFGQYKGFLTDYVTHIGKTMWVPVFWNDFWTPQSKYGIIMHEFMGHGYQSKKYTPFFYGIAYLFLPFFIGLAYCRYRFERQAYALSMAVAYYQYGDLRLGHIKSFVLQQLTGGAYLFAWPFKSAVMNYLNEQEKKIKETVDRDVSHRVAFDTYLLEVRN